MALRVCLPIACATIVVATVVMVNVTMDHKVRTTSTRPTLLSSCSSLVTVHSVFLLGSTGTSCLLGADCTDCGERNERDLGKFTCSNTCSHSNDGSCDDGGPGAGPCQHTCWCSMLCCALSVYPHATQVQSSKPVILALIVPIVVPVREVQRAWAESSPCAAMDACFLAMVTAMMVDQVPCSTAAP
jgi:hypothetical protein